MKACLKYFLAMMCAILLGTLFQLGALAATEIYTREDLEDIKNHCDDDFVLKADIDLSDAPWEPLLWLGGTLDGENHVITGLRIEGNYHDCNIGLFDQVKGTISRLKIEGMQIDVNVSGGFCEATAFGLPYDIWQSDPRHTPAHIIDCQVSGTAKIQASNGSSVGVSPLAGAQNSKAKFDVEISADTLSHRLLWNSVNCTAEGRSDITLTGRADGVCAVIQDCIDCTADYDFTVHQNGQENGPMALYGIASEIETGLCQNDVLHGSMEYQGYTAVIRGGVGCKSDVSAFSDQLYGMNTCRSCQLNGKLGNVGRLDEVYLTMMQDEDPGSDGQCSNCCDTDFVFRAGDTAPSSFNVRAVVGPKSVIYTPVCLKDMGKTDVTLVYEVTKVGIAPYRHGEIEIETTSGNIDVYCATASDAPVEGRSSSGNVTLFGGSSNSSAVTGESKTGQVSVIGGEHYNSGAVSATVQGSREAIAVGVSGENGYNCGIVVATSDGSGAPGAFGASGKDGWNEGAVSSIHRAAGEAAAIGSRFGVNMGDVTATTVDGDATAFGLDNGTYNGGNITARGTGKIIHANGTGRGGGTSVGTITADNFSSETYVVANAYGDAGTAIATGPVAYAEGAAATATSTHSGQTSTNGEYCWMMVYHSSADHGNCNAPYYIVNQSSQEFDDEYHNWDLFASTVVLGANAGQAPQTPQSEMPEEEEMDDSQIDVTFRLSSGVTGKEIKAFTRAYGSFNWDDGDNDDFTKVNFEITMENRGSKTTNRHFSIHLSDGFSFSPTQVISQQNMACTLSPGKPELLKLTIYPLYTSQRDDAMVATLKGDIRRVYSTPVSGIRNEGVVLMRATTNVNYADSVPLSEKIELDPVEDLVHTSVNRYSDRLAMLSCAISQSVYNKNYLENSDTSLTYTSLRNLGFSRIAWFGSDSSHDVAVGFAQKTIVDNGTVRNVLLIAVRGTVADEWIGNFNVIGEDSNFHDDFRKCANNVENRLAQYHQRYKIDKSSTRALLCGHSRAGAIVDLVAHDINTGALSNLIGELTAYTFAAPNSTMTPASDVNIFNYIYKYDMVPFVPHGNFGKYGVNIVVGGSNPSDAPNSVVSEFEKYTHGTPFKGVGSELIIQAILATDQIRSLYAFTTMYQRKVGNLLLGNIKHKENGDFIARAHGAENYLSWVKCNGASNYTSLDRFESEQANKLSTKLMSAVPHAIIGLCSSKGHPFASAAIDVLWDYMPITYPNGATVIGVGCPVDVEVLDDNSNVLGKLTEHREQAMENDVLALGDGEASFLYIPTGTHYTLRVTATGNGTMTLDCAYFRTGSECDEAETFVDIPVSKGEIFNLQGVAESQCVPVLVSSSGEAYFPDSFNGAFRLPTELRSIEENAFLNDSCVQGFLSLPRGVEQIGSAAFKGTKLTGVYIPEAVKSIADDAFDAMKLTVYCHKGSYAESWAKKNGLRYVQIP